VKFVDLTVIVFGYLAAIFFWVMLLALVFVGVAVGLHALGVFTCNEVWCT